MKIFKTDAEYNAFYDGSALMRSGEVNYVIDSSTIHYATNNIDGKYHIYNAKVNSVISFDGEDVVDAMVEPMVEPEVTAEEDTKQKK